jgi:hypothetical protein
MKLPVTREGSEYGGREGSQFPSLFPCIAASKAVPSLVKHCP